MSTKSNRKGSRKSKNNKNIKPSYVKQYNKDKRKSSSSPGDDNKLPQIARAQFQRAHPFVIEDYKFKQNKFYNDQPALTNKSIALYKNVDNFNWYQYVNQYSNSSEECLNIKIKENSNNNGDSRRIDSTSCTDSDNLKFQDNELKQLLQTANKIYKSTMMELFESYINGIESILNIILSFKGLHLFPIRYSVEILPFLHPTVRNISQRKSIWDKAIKNRTKSDALSHAVIDFIPNNLGINIIEDIYDEFVEHIRNSFKLNGTYSEEAIFYIPSGFSMGVQSKNHNRNNYEINQIQAKNIFTRLYIDSLCNFTIGNKQNAFWLDLLGINYYYFETKRRYSPISWGSRSRCWSQNGMVLMSDGKTRKSVKDLCIGDKVAVLQSLPNGITNECKSATVKVKIESIVNREYEMVGVKSKDGQIMYISPYHAVIDNDNNNNKWMMPCNLNKINKRYESSIYNFILDKGHTLNVNGIWACTLGHDLKGDVIENPIWGSSYVMYDYFKDKKGFPNVIEYI